jgi:uncharacterized protein YjiS (DUF1127 family)
MRRLARAIGRAMRNGVDAWRLRRSLQKAASLDDRTLADLGLCRSDIEFAVRRPMPRDWMQAG